jgi:hypothetical protein
MALATLVYADADNAFLGKTKTTRCPKLASGVGITKVNVKVKQSHYKP